MAFPVHSAMSLLGGERAFSQNQGPGGCVVLGWLTSWSIPLPFGCGGGVRPTHRRGLQGDRCPLIPPALDSCLASPSAGSRHRSRTWDLAWGSQRAGEAGVQTRPWPELWMGVRVVLEGLLEELGARSPQGWGGSGRSLRAETWQYLAAGAQGVVEAETQSLPMARESPGALWIGDLYLVNQTSDLCPSVYSRSGWSPAGRSLLAGAMAEAGDAALSVAEWLRALHLEQYARLFEQHGLVWATECQGLSDARLVDMGVLLPGHRRRILAGLLRAHTPPAPAPRPAPRPVPMKRHVFRSPPVPAAPLEPLPTAGEDEGLPTAPPIPPRRSCIPPACFSTPSAAAPDPVLPPLPAKRHLPEQCVPPVPPRTGPPRPLVR